LILVVLQLSFIKYTVFGSNANVLIQDFGFSTPNILSLHVAGMGFISHRFLSIFPPLDAVRGLALPRAFFAGHIKKNLRI
jgi:hypothetical protein